MSDAMQTAWAIGSYEGEQAKHVLSLAESGVGYILLERGGNKVNPACLVAFRRALDEPLPPHLQEVKDPFRIAEFEKTRMLRQGLEERNMDVKVASQKTIEKVRKGLR